MLDVIQRLASAPPHRGISLCGEASDTPPLISYADMAARVAACAEHYRALGVQPGQHVILPFETTEPVLCSLFALMEVGAVPLSVKPHIFSTPKQGYIDFLARIATRYGAEGILDVPSLQGLSLPMRRLALPAAGLKQPGARLREVSPEELAFVQFSSGSTSFPKGVPITQRNLMKNLELIAGHDGRCAEDRGASWLPLYHDMGLISLLTCLIAGNDVYVSQPMSFLMDPLGWLRDLSERRIHISVIPNFAIDYLLKNVQGSEEELLEGLELSALRIIYLGSEPINIDNLTRFTELLAPYGLKRNVVKPCYGMAEAVLMVSCTSMEGSWRVRSAPNGLRAISVGAPMGAFEVRLRSEEGRLCAEEELGEIEVKGGSLASSYYQSDQPLVGEEGFYATGDVGFMAQGELFITGRINDRIKVNGQSYFSSDFEQAIERLPFIRPGRTAVIQVQGRVVVLAEVNHPSVLAQQSMHQKQVCEAVLGGVGVTLAPADVLFIRYGQLQKTSSGKLQRRAMMEAYEQGRIRLATRMSLWGDLVRMRARRLVLGSLLAVQQGFKRLVAARQGAEP